MVLPLPYSVNGLTLTVFWEWSYPYRILRMVLPLPYSENGLNLTVFWEWSYPYCILRMVIFLPYSDNGPPKCELVAAINARENPSDLHATCAACRLHPSSHILPHLPSWYISSVPVPGAVPPTNVSSPSVPAGLGSSCPNAIPKIHVIMHTSTVSMATTYLQTIKKCWIIQSPVNTTWYKPPLHSIIHHTTLLLCTICQQTKALV